MGKAFVRRIIAFWLLALMSAFTLVPSDAAAQGTPVPPPPVRSTLDANGVNLTSGDLLIAMTFAQRTAQLARSQSRISCPQHNLPTGIPATSEVRSETMSATAVDVHAK